MSTLIETLKENSPDLYKRAMTHVTLDEIEHIGSDFHKLTKPVYAVLDTENNKAVHLHGATYQLVPYAKILKGLSDALLKYGIGLANTSIQFNVHPDLNYLRLRILFNDGSKFSPYSMSRDSKDKLKFGIEVVSSYDASIVYQIRAMFLRLICQNGI